MTLIAAVPAPSSPNEGHWAFLMTDIEGSSRLWERFPDDMRVVLPRHDALLQDAIRSHGGWIVKGTGDGLHAAFPDAISAVRAGLAAQRALLTEPWPKNVALKVRMAIHLGPAEQRDGDYYGPTVNRLARLLAVGHGGQTLLSGAVQREIGNRLPDRSTLVNLGRVRLRDLSTPEQVYQIDLAEPPSRFPPLRSLETLPNNLPQVLTTFVGRKSEIAAVRAMMGRSRLLTLVGPGGTGKSRLSLHVAADLLTGEGDGVWLVELAGITDPDRVPAAVAAVLEVGDTPGVTAIDAVIEHLCERDLLLILDNCEHLIGACAAFADRVLRACPSICLLASSREPLGIAGEALFQVPPLSLPDPRTVTLESLADSDASVLFVERAVTVRPDFAPTRENVVAIADICRSLDGIPLALELAAARVRSLSVVEINDRLTDRFRLLTGGSRTALPRQQTLRALIDWSYDLLNAAERTVLRRLSVFVGGWTLEAAEIVCAGGEVAAAEVLDLLTNLTDKSLVFTDVPTDDNAAVGMRYRLLETIRQYAGQRLSEDPLDARATRFRHVRYFLDLAEVAGSRRSSSDEVSLLAQLELEHDNLRSVLDTLSVNPADAPARLQLASALAHFWGMRGHLTEGRARLGAALAAVGDGVPAERRFAALKGYAILCLDQGDPLAARAPLEQALAIARATGNDLGVAATLNSLGNVAFEASLDEPGASALYLESLSIARSIGDKRSIATAVNNVGLMARSRRDLDEARRCFEESMALRRELGDQWGVAMSLITITTIAVEQHDYKIAEGWLLQALGIFERLGARPNIAYVVNALAELAIETGEPQRSMPLNLRSLAIRLELRDMPGIALTLYDIAIALAQLGQPFNALRAAIAAQEIEKRFKIVVPPNLHERYERDIYDVVRGQLTDAEHEIARSAVIAIGWEKEADRLLALPDGG